MSRSAGILAAFAAFVALAAFAALAACGDPQGSGTAPKQPTDRARHGPKPTWVERGNWIPEWSSYAPTEAIGMDGKRVMTMTPASGATQHVRDADSPSLVDSGIRPRAKLGMSTIPLEAGTLDLRVGEVVERNVLQDQLEAIGTNGESAQVYWTWRRRAVKNENGQAVEIPFSTVLIEGVKPGRTEVSLHWPESVRQSLVINVTAP